VEQLVFIWGSWPSLPSWLSQGETLSREMGRSDPQAIRGNRPPELAKQLKSNSFGKAGTLPVLQLSHAPAVPRRAQKR
jgi:hypothetical protein